MTIRKPTSATLARIGMAMVALWSPEVYGAKSTATYDPNAIRRRRGRTKSCKKKR